MGSVLKPFQTATLNYCIKIYYPKLKFHNSVDLFYLNKYKNYDFYTSKLTKNEYLAF